jgi:hypothetical protein
MHSYQGLQNITKYLHLVFGLFLLDVFLALHEMDWTKFVPLCFKGTSDNIEIVFRLRGSI